MVKTFDDFVKKSKDIHGDKYEYLSLKKIENVNFLEIKCSIHGIFKKKYQIISIINKDVLIVLKLIN